MSKARALLVGVDHYDEMPPLAGCANDAQAILSRHYNLVANFACRLRVVDSPDVQYTRDEMLADIEQLLSGGSNTCLLFFAGHGASHEGDLSLCSSDGTDQTPGVRLSEILTIAARSPADEIFVILDCCYSGAAGGVPQLSPSGAFMPEGTAILAASRGDQEVEETEHRRGAFSTNLEAGLEGEAADIFGKVTIAGLYSYVSDLFGVWDYQQPVLKANIQRLTPLRVAEPAIDAPALHGLVQLFSGIGDTYQLDPTYVVSDSSHDQTKLETLELLQHCEIAGLVESIGGPGSILEAAKASRQCRLTKLGRRCYTHAVKQYL